MNTIVYGIVVISVQSIGQLNYKLAVKRLGKCVRQNSIPTRKRGARQRGPKPLKIPEGAANLQSSHNEISKFPGCTQRPKRN